MAGKTLNLKAGWRYFLRDKTEIRLIEHRSVPYRDGASGKMAEHGFWIGQLVDHSGQTLTWQDNGSYSPVAASSLDIVRRAK